jgi:hypothetical protein
MIRYALIAVVVGSAWAGIAGRGLAGDVPGQPFDPFAFDGANNIVEEAHFGIVNGKLTAGIKYRNVLGNAGLWAPPYVSSDFTLDGTILGERIPTERYTWHPFHVERTGTVQGLGVSTITMLVPGRRAGLLEISLTNPDVAARTVPIEIAVNGTLDDAGPVDANGGKGWSFATPASRTPTARKVTEGILRMEQGNLAIVLRGSPGFSWLESPPFSRGKLSVSVPGQGHARAHVVFSVGPSGEAAAASEALIANPGPSLAESLKGYARRVDELFSRLPRLESSSRELEHFYCRALVPLLMNRWDVPEFVLNPYYSTGSVNGGCVGNYLWDFGGNWEIFPLLDPEATKTHLKQFLAIDTTRHFAFDPTTGKAFGPWYPVNQEKIVGLIYYYVKVTGDQAFLGETFDGKTILEHAIANALYGDDLSRPVSLIDYGPSNSHLELRRGFPYNHVMPDLNGRRYETYLRAAELSELAGRPMPQLRQRAEDLKAELKRRLWNPQAGWFDFENARGEKNLRYTVQMFKLFGSRVLDAGQEAALLRHLVSEREFLTPYGLESMAKTDIAYDPVDYDNGGGGCFTAFPAAIAERLYKSGHADVAENILRRILWWGDRTPYWGDSFSAIEIAYRRDTPLQSTIDSAVAAQSLIFGLFGVEPQFNGEVTINPHPPKFAPRISLKGLRIRGHVLNVDVDGSEYAVSDGKTQTRAPIGRPTRVPAVNQK